jgi:hypothetical protein
LDKQAKYFEACEAMTGDPPFLRDDYGFLIMTKNLFGQNSEEFYKGFPDVDTE